MTTIHLLLIIIITTTTTFSAHAAGNNNHASNVAKLFTLVDKDQTGTLDCKELNFPDCEEQLDGSLVTPGTFGALLEQLAEANNVPVEGFVEGAVAYQTKGKRMNLEEIRKDEEIANEPTDEDIARAEAAGDPDEDEGGREL